jgi:hypothetical protein
MWFKVFVVLRIPIAVLCLSGFVIAFGMWGAAAAIAIGSLFLVGLYVFLAVVSIRLVQRRPGTLRSAGWLLALEAVGAVLFLSSDMSTAYDYALLFAWGCVVLVVWTLPNAFAFYKARSLFTEPAKEKPGL